MAPPPKSEGAGWVDGALRTRSERAEASSLPRTAAPLISERADLSRRRPREGGSQQPT